MTVAWGDVPDEVRRGLEPVLPGPDTHPIVEVQFFVRPHMAAKGLAVVRSRCVAWNIVWNEWRDAQASGEVPWAEKNPWRRHHTRNYWAWFRREPRTSGGLRFTIETDGRVVWVNSERGLIGRFSRDGGVDVHNVPGEPTTCEDCFPEPDWERFQAGMLRVHGVVVDDKFKPMEA